MMNLKSLREWIRGKWGRRKKRAEQVLLTVSRESTLSEKLRSPEPNARIKLLTAQEQEIDFRPMDDLESYAENLNVPIETIEKWISAGLLYPDEIRVAEKMIQIMMEKNRPRKPGSKLKH